MGISKANYTQSLAELVGHANSGCNHAQRVIYQQFYIEAFNIAKRYSSNLEDAKEILNNAFLKAFNRLDTFDSSKPFIPWLMRIIIHASSDFYRYQHEPTRRLENTAEPVFKAGIIEHLRYEELLSLVQQLPNEYRVVFNLFVVDGFHHNEIAFILDISEGTSKCYLSRARSKLKEMLKAQSIKETR